MRSTEERFASPLKAVAKRYHQLNDGAVFAETYRYSFFL